MLFGNIKLLWHSVKPVRWPHQVVSIVKQCYETDVRNKPLKDLIPSVPSRLCCKYIASVQIDSFALEVIQYLGQNGAKAH